MNEITREIIGHLTERREYAVGEPTDTGYYRVLNRSNIHTVAELGGDDLLKDALGYFIERVNSAENPDEAWSAIANRWSKIGEISEPGYGPEHEDLSDLVVDVAHDFVGSAVIYYDDTARYFAGTRAWEWEENCEELLGGERTISQMQIILFVVVEVFIWSIIEELNENAPWGVTDEECDNEVAAEAAAQEEN